MRSRPSRPLRLDRIEAYLDACFTRESPPRVSELARVLGLSLKQLMETFRDHVGVKPAVYLRRQQIASAKQLLRRTKFRVDRVGYMVGFGTRRTFFRVFQRLTGLTPPSSAGRQNDTRPEEWRCDFVFLVGNPTAAFFSSGPWSRYPTCRHEVLAWKWEA